MVKELSLRLAHSLGNNLQADGDDIEVYAYGLEILLCSLIKLVLLLSLALVLHILFPTLLVLAAWVGFRVPGGGAHMESYTHCLSTGLVILLALAALSTYNLSFHWLLALLVMTTILALVCIIRWVPAGTEKKQIRQADKRRKQKLETSGFLTLWLVSVVCLIAFGCSHYALPMILGACGGLYAITPIGYRTLGWLDQNMTNIERRIGICLEKCGYGH